MKFRRFYALPLKRSSCLTRCSLLFAITLVATEPTTVSLLFPVVECKKQSGTGHSITGKLSKASFTEGERNKATEVEPTCTIANPASYADSVSVSCICRT